MPLANRNQFSCVSIKKGHQAGGARWGEKTVADSETTQCQHPYPHLL